MRSLKKIEGINVVPLIDVVLALLAITLAISTFVAAGQIKLDLPDASSAEKLPYKSVDISIVGNGEFYFGGEAVTKNALSQKIASLTAKDIVTIRGDKKSAFEDFVFVLDRLKSRGVEKISIATKDNA